MRPIRTITARLSGVFLSLLLPVILLGLFSIASLRYFNGISSQVQERWLPSTRALGDLNNFTSDFRAAEAATLLAVDANELAARVQEMADLDRVVSKAQRDDSQISHDATEQALYARFSADWLEYRDIVRRVQTLSQTGGRAATVALYNTTSKQAYAAASDTLNLLTDRNVVSAGEATVQAQVPYRRALWLITLTMLLSAACFPCLPVTVRGFQRMTP